MGSPHSHTDFDTPEKNHHPTEVFSSYSVLSPLQTPTRKVGRLFEFRSSLFSAWRTLVASSHPLDKSLDVTILKRSSGPSQSRFEECPKTLVEGGFPPLTSFYAYPKPSLELMVDASLYGWCGLLLPSQVQEEWPASLFPESINWKELQAIFLTVVHFLPKLQGRTVRIWMDNWTALTCIRRQGSFHSQKLWHLTKELLEFCHRHQITLVPSHLQGTLNVLADKGSRRGSIGTEWSLDPDSFHEICTWAGTPQVDLFTTRFNAQLSNFVSPCPDPSACYMDAFSRDWDVWDSIFLFPPFQVLQRVVSLLQVFKGKGFLIALTGRLPPGSSR